MTTDPFDMWGKTVRDNITSHRPLIYHLIDTAWVGRKYGTVRYLPMLRPTSAPVLGRSKEREVVVRLLGGAA